jgi:hypothetical protein
MRIGNKKSARLEEKILDACAFIVSYPSAQRRRNSCRRSGAGDFQNVYAQRDSKIPMSTVVSSSEIATTGPSRLPSWQSFPMMISFPCLCPFYFIGLRCDNP